MFTNYEDFRSIYLRNNIEYNTYNPTTVKLPTKKPFTADLRILNGSSDSSDTAITFGAAAKTAVDGNKDCSTVSDWGIRAT